MSPLWRAAAGAATLELPRGVYSEYALRIALHVFTRRAEAEAEEVRSGWRVTLRPLGQAGLDALAGDFLNELLNQEYRFAVSALNRKVSGFLVTQALLSARGGENPPPQPEEDAAFRAEAEGMLREAKEESGG